MQKGPCSFTKSIHSPNYTIHSSHVLAVKTLYYVLAWILTLLYLLFTKAKHQGRAPTGGGGNDAVSSGDRRGNSGTGGHGVLTRELRGTCMGEMVALRHQQGGFVRGTAVRLHTQHGEDSGRGPGADGGGTV